MFVKALSIAALLASIPVTVVAAPASSEQHERSTGSAAPEIDSTADRQPANFCAGTANDPQLMRQYVCGDSRLGPVRLPTMLPLSVELEIYDRFGAGAQHLAPGDFLTEWYNTATSSWIYPPQNGFSVDALTGLPISGNVTLAAGALIDRFGSEYGAFASPAGAPYMQRALPPSNLDTPQNDLRLLEPLTVLEGPIAPWFGQPGQGVQYMLLNTNIMNLINAGVLERVDPSVILE
ncbi:hypothetical protein BX600DRAFT_441527 [Xylariales sp. PMI_506]|nr:hypothetical protein BX600DRAFT_441527 [Xylariales sp. PMI_506]